MPQVLNVQVRGWTQTLEASVTSASTVDDGRRIELDYPVTFVTGVYDNVNGTGTNYWTVYPKGDVRGQQQISPAGKYILLPKLSGLAAATNCWVTYGVSDMIQPVYGGMGTMGIAGLDVYSKKAVKTSFTTEMTDKNTGVPERVYLDPQSVGMVVRSLKVITNGTNITMYVWSDPGTGPSGTYAETNRDTDQAVGNATINAAGQSFTGDGGLIRTARLWLKKVLLPTGNATCKIYASTGSDPNRTPTGVALATSNPVDVSTIGTSYAWIDFTFPLDYTVVNATTYFLVLDYALGTAANYLHWGTDTSTPSYASNNFATYTSSWAAAATTDACFTMQTYTDPLDISIIYRGSAINLLLIDNNDWVIDGTLNKVWVGYVDTGANATPGSTQIELRGSPLV